MLETELETQSEQDAPNWDESIASAWADITKGEEPATKSEDEFNADVDKVSAQVARDEAGRFKANDIKTEGATLEATEQPAELPTEQVDTRAPSSWRKEAQAEFAKLPPLIKEEVLRREESIHKGIEQYKGLAQRGQAYEEVAQPYAPLLQQLGVQPQEAFRALLNAESQLRNGSPAQKAQMTLKLISDYGIDRDAVLQALQSGELPQVDPAYQRLEQEVQSIKSQQAERERMERARESEALNSEIARFSQGKEHFEAVRDDMAALIQVGKAKTLEEAYQKAIRLNDEVWNAVQAKQRAAEQAELAKRAKEAKRSASVNVASRGVIQPKAAVGTWDDSISAEAKRLGLM